MIMKENFANEFQTASSPMKLKENKNQNNNKLSYNKKNTKHSKVNSIQTNKHLKITTTDIEGETTTPQNLKIEGQRGSNNDNSDLIINMSVKHTPHKSFNKKDNKESNSNLKDKQRNKLTLSNNNFNNNNQNNNNQVSNNSNKDTVSKVNTDNKFSIDQPPTKTRIDYHGNKIIKKGRKHHITFIDIIKKGKLEDIVDIRKIEDIEESFEEEILKKNSESKKSNNSKNSKKSNESKNKVNNIVNNQHDENCSCACVIF